MTLNTHSALQRYAASDIPALMEKITKNSIGLDNYFDDFFKIQTPSNYPPYNLIQLNNHESKLEIALAGFKKDEVKVYTEFGKLHVEGIKEDKETDAEYRHCLLYTSDACLLYTSPSPRDRQKSRMPSSA